MMKLQDVQRATGKSHIPVDYSMPPYAQRSMIPRAKGSNSRLREASREQATSTKQSHVAFLQKSEQEIRQSSMQGGNVTNLSAPYGVTSREHDPISSSPIAAPRDDGAESKWIHRDKLIQIEQEESKQADGRLENWDNGEGGAITSTVLSSTDLDRSAPDNDLVAPSSKRQRVDSPLNRGVGEGDGETSPTSAGYREFTPQMTPLKANDARVASRSGTSRIPIASNSPSALSTSPGIATPGQGRNGTVRLVPNPSGSIKYMKPRDRQVGDVNSSPNTPTIRSPSNAQSPLSISTLPTTEARGVSSASKARPQSRGASGNLSREGSGARMSSNTYKQRRPLSSGGPRNPINRPEGEAPWIADMYKPDPMLPQDEQIVPTHAKRLGLHLLKADSIKRMSVPTGDSALMDQGDGAVPAIALEDSAQVLEEGGEDENDDGVEEDYDMVRQREKGPTFLAWKTASTRDRNAPPHSTAALPNDRKVDERLQEASPPKVEQSNVPPLTRLPSGQRERSESPIPASTTTKADSNTGRSDESSQKPSNKPAPVEPVHGGYKVMPTVRTPAEMEQAVSLHPALRGASPPPVTSQQSFKGRYPQLPRPQAERQSSRAKSPMAPAPQAAAATTKPVATRPIRAMNMEEPTQEKVKKGCGGCCILM